MPRVLVNVMSNDWAVHFIGPDGKTRIGPWLLLDGPEEVLAILTWGKSRRKSWKNTRAAFDVGVCRLCCLILRSGKSQPWWNVDAGGTGMVTNCSR